MKQISIWASKHVVLARFLLTFIHIALVGIACLLGFLLFLDEIIIEKRAIFLLWTVFLVAYFLYPLKNPRYPFWKNWQVQFPKKRPPLTFRPAVVQD